MLFDPWTTARCATTVSRRLQAVSCCTRWQLPHRGNSDASHRTWPIESILWRSFIRAFPSLLLVPHRNPGLFAVRECSPSIPDKSHRRRARGTTRGAPIIVGAGTPRNGPANMTMLREDFARQTGGTVLKSTPFHSANLQYGPVSPATRYLEQVLACQRQTAPLQTGAGIVSMRCS